MKRIIVLLLLSAVVGLRGNAQDITALQKQISYKLASMKPANLAIGNIEVKSILVDDKKKTVCVEMGDSFSYIPLRKNNVAEYYKTVKALLPENYSSYKLSIKSSGNPIENLQLYSDKGKTFTTKCDRPLVTRLSSPYVPEKGLSGRHIALWQSHGFYFEAKLNRWEWQRARIFQTVEDLYTQSYVMPFLVPMLENAGACVLTPRERDINTHEVIVDNDRNSDSSVYEEFNGTAKNLWETGGTGFSHLREYYIDNQNPFMEGTYRQIKTVKDGKKVNDSKIKWTPFIPESGEYAVYVSYKTVENSTDDAHYTVCHKGGKTDFLVNQTMGGGTWIYLGHFTFDKGKTGYVELSNRSRKAGRVLTADAVKIGGGYGNIARKVGNRISDNVKSAEAVAKEKELEAPSIDYEYELSGYPRFTEAARYWLQWAGFPEKVYSLSKGVNDYTDDYKSRGEWVNYLAGGSSVLPDSAGLNIPVDMAFAFHSDAGTTPNDSIIGTLGIFCTGINGAEPKFANKINRYVSRDLVDLIMTNIVNDIRRLHEPEWTRRGMWNQSYFEARVPQVPTMLLELLSHQNFADMRYGLDPRFRFTVSRAIYKGMLQFLSHQYNRDYVVQPLPVDHFSSVLSDEGEVLLRWNAVNDPLETTAVPDKYIVYTRIGDGSFDNGVLVDDTFFRRRVEPGKIYSFKITAVNEGGESFPSEILSVYRAPQSKGMVLIVNGFDRVSAPDDFVSDGIAGFYDEKDHGVPFLRDINYIGSQYEFRRRIPWMDDDAAGFGASRSVYEDKVIAGNTFDYPALHGRSIAKAGYSFVSSSDEAVMDGMTDVNKYRYIDLILGKEKQVKMGRGVYDAQFKTFPAALQNAIAGYCRQGGRILVTGAFIATDLWDREDALEEDKKFATDILHYSWRTGQASVEGKVKSVASPFKMFEKQAPEFYNVPNEQSYVVESPDGIEPSGEGSYTIFRYAENNLSAGIAYDGQEYKTCILGFPFESIKEERQRDILMKSILNFFEENNTK